MAVLTTVLSLSSCQKERKSLISDNISDGAALSNSARSSAPLKVNVVLIDMDIKVGANLYFDNRTAPHTKVVVPDGHALTLAELHLVSGCAFVKCVNEETQGVVH